MKPNLLPRSAEKSLRQALEFSPVVLLHGPRQCGKTTLAKMVGIPQGYRYLSFDDPDVLEYATADPKSFTRGLPERCILDEVQKVPRLFSVLKMEVDRERIPGRFMLTGSSNVFLLPTLSDSLAGRMIILRLYPFSQVELMRQSPNFLDRLFSEAFEAAWTPPDSDAQIIPRIVSGGYPAALEFPAEEIRNHWYRNHIESIIQRDVRELVRIRSLEIFSKLLAKIADQTAQLCNTSTLSKSLEVSRPTVQSHVALLERMFFLERIYPWRDNKPRRIIKTPKMHLCDTGIACTLLNLDSAALEANRTLFGHLLETFVFQELRRQGDAFGSENFSFYRDRAKIEVDVVIQRAIHELAGIEIKAAGVVKESDFLGLKRLRDILGPRFVCGVVLHNGEYVREFGDRLFAVPIRMLWETPKPVPSL